MDSSIYSKSSVKKSAKYFVVGRLLSGMSGFLTIILLAKYMSVENYAVFVALSAMIMLLGVLSTLGLDKAASRYLPKSIHDQNSRELVKIIASLGGVRLLVSIVFSFIIYISWGEVSKLFEYVDLQTLPIAFFIFFVSESLFQYFSKIFQTLMLQKVLTQILVIQWFGRLLLIFFLLYQAGEISIENAFWVMAIPEVIGLFFFIWILLRYVKKHKQDTSVQSINMSSSTDWHGIYHVAKNNYGFSLLAVPAQGYFMRLIVSVFFSAEVSAAYGFLSLMVERVVQYIPVKFFNAMIEPVLVSNYIKNQDFNHLRIVSQVFYKFSLIFLASFALFVSASGELLLENFIKTEYAEYYWFVFIILFQDVFGAHVNTLQIILNSVNKSKALVYSSAISMIVFIVLFYVFITYGSGKFFLLFLPIVFSVVNNYVVISWLNMSGFDYYIEVRSLFLFFIFMSLILLLIQFLARYTLFEDSVLYASGIGIVAILLFFILLKYFNFFVKNEVFMIKQYIFKA